MTKCIHQPNISSKNKDWIYSIKDIEDIFGIYFKNQTKQQHSKTHHAQHKNKRIN